MSKEAMFWQWFLDHQDELFEFEHDQEAVFDRLAAELSEIDDDLTFEFGPAEGGVREFVISAAGIRTAFPAVNALYDARPKLTRFRVTAFRPRRGVSFAIECAGLKINAHDVYFRLGKDEDSTKVGILLFLPGYDENRNHEFGQVGYLFLDSALGEFDVETKVGFIEIRGHDSDYFAGAAPIQHLPADFDRVIESK